MLLPLSANADELIKADNKVRAERTFDKCPVG